MVVSSVADSFEPYAPTCEDNFANDVDYSTEATNCEELISKLISLCLVESLYRCCNCPDPRS